MVAELESRRGHLPSVALGTLAGTLVILQAFLLAGVIDAAFLRRHDLSQLALPLLALAGVV